MKQLIIDTTRRICESEVRIKYYDDLLLKEKDECFIELIKLSREISVLCLDDYRRILDSIKEL